MKKYASILMASALVSSLLIQPTAFANENENTTVEQEEIQQENFFQVTGKIESIKKEEAGNYFAQVKNGNDEFGFYYDENTVIYNAVGEQVEISEGIEIMAIIDARKPMTMIYPPRYSPEVVIVKTKDPGTVELQKFNDTLLNEKGDLVINITDKTTIHDLDGKELAKEAVVDKDVLIFYDYVLESYPAKTTPFKIVVLGKETSKIDKAIEIAKEDYYEVNGVTMIPLRRVAEQLEFQVESEGKVAILSKGRVSFTITLGSKQYGYNKALRYFDEEPALLEKGKTYVPYELLEQLIEITDKK